VVVKARGEFLERVKACNMAISRLRAEMLEVRGLYREWSDVADSNRLTVIWGAKDGFLSRLCQRPEVHTITLPWSHPPDPRMDSPGRHV